MQRWLSLALLLTLLSLECDAANTTCNGYESLCSKLYSNVTFLGAHNSYSVGSSISNNQHYGVATQLDDGVRLLQGQGHNGTNKAGSMIELCHSACALEDGGTLESYLGKVVTWVEANPDEVVTILWVNSDNMPASNWASAYVSTGLANYSYVPSSNQVAAWPTMQALIDDKTTVVNFLTSESDYSVAPYLLGEWANIWETPYENTNYKNFTCELDRGTRPNLLYLANHFAYKETTLLGASIDSPDTDDIDKTNSISNMMQHADLCASENSVYPNFFLVDYYEKASGGALQAVAEMNEVTYVAKTLGDGKTASALATFFGGQNEIRNAVIVAVSGFIVLVTAWCVTCCCCRRHRRRGKAIPMDDYPKTAPSAPKYLPTAAPRPATSDTSSAKYKPLQQVHEMLAPPRPSVPLSTSQSRTSLAGSSTAFNDIRGQTRPLPSAPVPQYGGGGQQYSRYQDYRAQSHLSDNYWRPG